MQTNFVVAKWLSNRIILRWIASITLLIVSGLVGVQWLLLLHVFPSSQLWLDLQHYQYAIGIIYICFGVILEGREVMLKRFATNVQLHRQYHTSQLCEYYGVMILVIGLVIEVLEALMQLLSVDGLTAVVIHALLFTPFNLYGLLLLFNLLSHVYPNDKLLLLVKTPLMRKGK